jgi:hypothetical protein
MSKLHKKVRTNENRCASLHRDMNMTVGPTRLEGLGNLPSFILPNLDPLQQQVNRIENRLNYEERISRRRAWKKNQ